MIGQHNSNVEQAGSRKSADHRTPRKQAYDFFNRNTQRLKFGATHRKQTTAPRFNRNTDAMFLASPDGSPRRSVPSFQPLTSSFLIATVANSKFESTDSKQRTRQISNRNKFATFGRRAGGPAASSDFALGTIPQLPATALIADPRLELAASRSKQTKGADSNRLKKGGKPGGSPRCCGTAPIGRPFDSAQDGLAFPGKAGSRQDALRLASGRAGATKARTKNGQSADPWVLLPPTPRLRRARRTIWHSHGVTSHSRMFGTTSHGSLVTYHQSPVTAFLLY